MAGPSWKDHASHAVRHFAEGTTVEILSKADPTLAAVEVPAVFPDMTFEEQITLAAGTIKVQIAAKDLGSMPLDGRSVIRLPGGRQYTFTPVSGDGAVAASSVPRDSQALITGYISSGGRRA